MVFTGFKQGAQAPSEPSPFNTSQDRDSNQPGERGSPTRQRLRATILTGPFPKRLMPRTTRPCCSPAHAQPRILHLSPQSTHTEKNPSQQSLKERAGRGEKTNNKKTTKQLLGFRGKALKARESNASETEREMARAGRDGNAPHGAATAERTLKWRPWGRRVSVKLRNKRWQEARQRHLPRALPLPLARRAAPQTLAAEPGHGRSHLRRTSPLSSKASFAPDCRAPRRRGAGWGGGGAENQGKAKASTSLSFPPVII